MGWASEMLRSLPAAMVAVALLLPGSAWAGTLVLVVPAGSAMVDVSTVDLRRAFLGNRVKSPDGTKLRPLNLPEGHPARVAFDQAVLGMNEDEVGRYWVLQKIRAAGEPPLSQTSEAKLVELVTNLPGAITYVHPDAVTEGVKVITVDGKAADAADYPLRFDDPPAP